MLDATALPTAPQPTTVQVERHFTMAKTAKKRELHGKKKELRVIDFCFQIGWPLLCIKREKLFNVKQLSFRQNFGCQTLDAIFGRKNNNFLAQKVPKLCIAHTVHF